LDTNHECVLPLFLNLWTAGGSPSAASVCTARDRRACSTHPSRHAKAPISQSGATPGGGDKTKNLADAASTYIQPAEILKRDGSGAMCGKVTRATQSVAQVFELTLESSGYCGRSSGATNRK
jgi:hypothetical protein